MWTNIKRQLDLYIYSLPIYESKAILKGMHEKLDVMRQKTKAAINS